MAINPNVVPGQMQAVVQPHPVLPADDPLVFGVTTMSIGFNVATIQFLAMHGLDTMTHLYFIPLSQFDMMIKNINHPATFPAPVPGIPGVKLPYVAVMALKSICAWCDYRHSRDQILDPTDDPNLDLTVWTVRLDDLVCWLKLKDVKLLMVSLSSFPSRNGRHGTNSFVLPCVMLGIQLQVCLTCIWFYLISWWTLGILLWSTAQLMMIW
jgi:hypothetical protein